MAEKSVFLIVLMWLAVAISILAVLSILNDAGIIRINSSGDTYRITCMVSLDAPLQYAEEIMNLSCYDKRSPCVGSSISHSYDEGFLNMYIEDTLVDSLSSTQFNTPDYTYSLSGDGCVKPGFYQITINVTRLVKGRWPREISKGVLDMKVG